MSYEVLEIGSGDMAGPMWYRMLQMEDGEERESIRKNLLAYCEMDTEGMVRILQELAKLQ